MNLVHYTIIPYRVLIVWTNRKTRSIISKQTEFETKSQETNLLQVVKDCAQVVFQAHGALVVRTIIWIVELTVVDH